MKLLFLSALYPPHTKGGGELSTHYIAQGLVQLGHEVVVITSGHQSEEVVLDGVRVIRVPLAFTAKPLLERRHSLKMARRLQPIIEQLGSFDIYHAHDFRTAQVLSELPYEPKVVTARDYAQICGSTNALLDGGGICTCSWSDVWQNHRVVEASFPRNLFRIWQYRYNIGYRKTAFQKFKYQVFISHAQMALISQHQDLSHTQSVVIYNPIGPAYVQTPTIEPTNHDIVYIGTVESYKGVGTLLEAFHALANEFPNIQLKIVGEGADREHYEQLVASWGLQYRIQFTGQVPWNELLPIYDQAVIVVAPHIWIEPFGRTVIEGMARARLVVASALGGPAEIINDKQTGQLFTSGSVQSLSQCLRKALTMRPIDRREIRQAARSWVTEHLTSQQIAEQHVQLYQQIKAH